MKNFIVLIRECNKLSVFQPQFVLLLRLQLVGLLNLGLFEKLESSPPVTGFSTIHEKVKKIRTACQWEVQKAACGTSRESNILSVHLQV